MKDIKLAKKLIECSKKILAGSFDDKMTITSGSFDDKMEIKAGAFDQINEDLNQVVEKGIANFINEVKSSHNFAHNDVDSETREWNFNFHVIDIYKTLTSFGETQLILQVRTGKINTYPVIYLVTILNIEGNMAFIDKSALKIIIDDNEIIPDEESWCIMFPIELRNQYGSGPKKEGLMKDITNKVKESICDWIKRNEKNMVKVISDNVNRKFTAR